jgi:uridine phosphorylase
VPARLRPTAPIAADAILVGDPGRALMLAQELLQQPKMSNHARGLWGYTGVTHAGHDLTIQATGMGGPSATVVLHDLAELKVRRVVRIGTCTSLGVLEPGQLISVAEARTPAGDVATPSLELPELPELRVGSVLSLDVLHRHSPEPAVDGDAADMQTAALLAAATRLGVAAGALLIVAETFDGGQLGDEELEAVAKRAGEVAARLLSA